MQQDAHEFLNYLLNTIADLLQEEKSHERQQNGKVVQNGGSGRRMVEGVAAQEKGITEEKHQQNMGARDLPGPLTNETSVALETVKRSVRGGGVSQKYPCFGVVTSKEVFLLLYNEIRDEGFMGGMVLVTLALT